MSGSAREPRAVRVDVDGREVRLTNLDRVLWPAPPASPDATRRDERGSAGLTKGWMIDAYARLAPVMLPHLREHPVTMWRYPEGVHRQGWWQNECRGAPDWVRVYRYTGADGRAHRHCVVDDLATLLWMANLGTVEVHPFLYRAPEPATPRWLVFDLDPGEPATTRDACAVALRLREVLDGQGLASYPKTSGGRGIHVYVPLHTPVTFDETKAYSRTVAAFLARERPELVVDRQARELRRGKVLVDWLQNDRFRSTVAPYSLRATPQPRVSTPVGWDEVEAGAMARDDALAFGLDEVLARIQRDGDRFEPVLTRRQRLVPPA